MYMLHIFFCGGHTRRVWDYVLHTNGKAFSFFIYFIFAYISLWFVVVSFCRFVIVTLWTGPLCCVIELGDLLKPRKGLNYLFAFFRSGSQFFSGDIFSRLNKLVVCARRLFCSAQFFCTWTLWVLCVIISYEWTFRCFYYIRSGLKFSVLVLNSLGILFRGWIEFCTWVCKFHEELLCTTYVH